MSSGGCHLSLTFLAAGNPSGSVPAFVHGGRLWKSTESRRGGEEGPDSVFNFVSRVVLVKSRGLLVISVWGLFVNYPAVYWKASVAFRPLPR